MFEEFRRFEGFAGFGGFERFTFGELPARCRRGFARLKSLKGLPSVSSPTQENHFRRLWLSF